MPQHGESGGGWIPRSTGVVEALIAASVGSGLLPAVTFAWQQVFHGEPPEWAKGAVPNIVAALLLGTAFGLLSWRRARHRHATPEAKGDRISIYIADFVDDDASRTAGDHVRESILKELGKELVEVLPAGVQLRLSEDVSADEAANEAAKNARALLRKKRGDLLIWGRVYTRAQSSVIELRFVSAAQDGAEGQRFGFTEKFTLEAGFGTEMAAALAAVAVTLAVPVIQDRGKYMAGTLIPVANRLAPLIRGIPASMRPDDRARLLRSYGLLQSVIGEQAGDSRRLEEAVEAYRAALKERTRERVPLNWAATQNNLGIALMSLGERESGTGRLEEAVEAYREALEEWTRERVPLDWAMTQNNLGSALMSLGERESGTRRLEEAVEAYRAALKEWTADAARHYHSTVLSNLGSAEKLLEARITNSR